MMDDDRSDYHAMNANRYLGGVYCDVGYAPTRVARVSTRQRSSRVNEMTGMLYSELPTRNTLSPSLSVLSVKQ